MDGGRRGDGGGKEGRPTTGLGRRRRWPGGGLAEQADVEDPAHVGFKTCPDDEEGEEEQGHRPKRDPHARVVQREPLGPLIDVGCDVSPSGRGEMGVILGGVEVVGDVVDPVHGLEDVGDDNLIGLVCVVVPVAILERHESGQDGTEEVGEQGLT